MHSSARNSVHSASPIGSGYSIRSMAPRSSVGVRRTGEFRSRWRFAGPRNSRSSSNPRCDAVVGRPEMAVPSSRLGRATRPRRGPQGQYDLDACRCRARCCRRRFQSTSAAECDAATGDSRPADQARSWRNRCLLGRVLPCLGSRAVGAPGRGSRRPIHRQNRWTFKRSRRRPVLERQPSQRLLAALEYPTRL